MLAFAIIAEVSGTTSLKYSNGMTRLFPSALTILCYLTSFWLLSQTLKQLQLGYVYAVWCGVGIIGAKIAGCVLFRESISISSVVGTTLVVAGVIVLSLGATEA